jgi:hypothetical protein
MSKHQKIDLIGLIILMGFALAAFLCYLRGAYLHMPYPADTFLFVPSEKFTDFSGFYHFIASGNPYTRLDASPYYPLANFIFFLFTLLPLHLSFVIFTMIFLGFLSWFNTRALETGTRLDHMRNVFIYTFLTYPVLIAIDRGNMECVLFAFVLFFAYFFIKGRYYWSAFFLSLAIAMKAFPVLLALLFLAHRKYRVFVFTGLSTILVTLFSLTFFKCNPVDYLNMALHGRNIANDNSFSTFAGANHWIERGPGLFGVYKLALIASHAIHKMDMRRWIMLYYAAAIFTAILIAAFVIWIETILWKQIALLVFMMLLLPHISGDYRLLYVFVPMLIFVNYERVQRRDVIYATLFGLLLIPKDYFFIPHTETDALVGDGSHKLAQIGISILLNPLLLVTFSTLIITDGLKDKSEKQKCINE